MCVDGFQNAVRCETSDRKLLEQLCRNITRPALKLKTPGETAPCTQLMSPLGFMQRLACRAASEAVPAPVPWGAGAECEAPTKVLAALDHMSATSATAQHATVPVPRACRTKVGFATGNSAMRPSLMGRVRDFAVVSCSRSHALVVGHAIDIDATTSDWPVRMYS